MDFTLNEEQEIFRTYLRKLLEDKGSTMIVRNFIEGDESSLNETVEGLIELGAPSITIAEQYGGMGLGMHDALPVFEELGRVLLPGNYLETLGFVIPLLQNFAEEEQKATYLSRLALGKTEVVLAWLEPGNNYELNQLSTLAEIKGNQIEISGTKHLVPKFNDEDLCLMLVKTIEGEEEGFAFILLEGKELKDYKTKQNSLDESQPLCQIYLEKLSLPKNRIVGQRTDGEVMLKDSLPYLNAALCAFMVGGMERIVEMANEYAKIRIQFGQPIGRFQAIKHKIVDMKLKLETARSLSLYIHYALDQGDEEIDALLYGARAYITEAYKELALDNIQVHGGIGFTEEIDCHLYLKRARYYEHYLGSIGDYREKAANALQLVPKQ